MPEESTPLSGDSRAARATREVLGGAEARGGTRGLLDDLDRLDLGVDEALNRDPAPESSPDAQNAYRDFIASAVRRYGKRAAVIATVGIAATVVLPKAATVVSDSSDTRATAPDARVSGYSRMRELTTGIRQAHASALEQSPSREFRRGVQDSEHYMYRALLASLSHRPALQMGAAQEVLNWAVAVDNKEMIKEIGGLVQSFPDWERYAATNQIMRDIYWSASEAAMEKKRVRVAQHMMAKGSAFEEARLRAEQRGRVAPEDSLDEASWNAVLQSFLTTSRLQASGGQYASGVRAALSRSRQAIEDLAPGVRLEGAIRR